MLSRPLYSLMRPLSRSYSNLPVRSSYIPRTYPFPLILQTTLPLPIELQTQYFWRPSDKPRTKSKLIVDVRDLPLDKMERNIFISLAAGRTQQPDRTPRFMIMPKRNGLRKNLRNPHLCEFVCAQYPTNAQNENRVFDLLDSCIAESKRLAEEFRKSDREKLKNGEFLGWKTSRPLPPLDGEMESEEMISKPYPVPPLYDEGVEPLTAEEMSKRGITE